MNPESFKITQYTGKEFLPGFGSSGDLNPGEIAGKVYGEKYNYGYAVAYLLRRFGYSFSGHDDYKELAGYILTTPMEGIYLYVSIKGSNGAGYSFGVRFSRELYKKYNILRAMERRTGFRAAQKWGLSHGYAFVNSMSFTGKKKKANRIVNGYFNRLGLMNKTPADFTPEEWEKIWDECFEEMDNRKNRAFDELEASGWKNPASATYQDFCNEINAALETSLRELLKPTYVRDCLINILGPCDIDCTGCEYHKDDCEAPSGCIRRCEPWKFAGRGVLNFVEEHQKQKEELL